MDLIRTALLTREFPPEVYGGAGVHVEHLAAALAAVDGVEVAVHAFGGPRPSPLIKGTYEPWEALAGDRPELAALRTFATDLVMAAGVGEVDVVHSHTWYANLAGHLAGLMDGVPHVMTTHSLEPLRPWKREQLGGGYALSSFAERTAAEGASRIIAVSEGMRDDVLRAYPEVDPDRVVVVYNGIDPDVYRPVESHAALADHDVDPARPYAIFVGRITRQKGVTHLIDAARHLPAETQIVLCAGAPDTPEIAAEFREHVAAAREAGAEIVWIEEMLPREQIVQLLSHAGVFVCPSVYEPFGIVNLEAMACGAPVVASAVGGIPEIVVEGETGHLVEVGADPDDPTGVPSDPEAFAERLAAAIADVLDDPGRAEQMGQSGRQRVEDQFSWGAIAQQTAAVYRAAIEEHAGKR